MRFKKTDYALRFAHFGYRVFQCHWIDDGRCSCGDLGCAHPGKHPIFRGWQTAANTNPNCLRRWWAQKTLANPAIACGVGSNLTALDIDGAVGLDRLAELEREHEALPAAPRVLTGSGGVHLYFRYEPELRNAVRFDDGLDIRTEGGLVIAPGAANARGPYTFEVGFTVADLPRAKMPTWLMELVKKGQTSAAGDGHFTLPPQPVLEGNGRNSLIYRAGRSMRAKGFGARAIELALAATNEEQCCPPLGPVEFGSILKSVLTQPDVAVWRRDEARG